MDCSDPRKFLLSVPYNYTEEMTYINNDILLTHMQKSINTGRLNFFYKTLKKEYQTVFFIQPLAWMVLLQQVF